MFLSIIIPTYNGEKYLHECLDSCLDQDCQSNDYEIICVDDGSTDRTPQMLLEYAQQYPIIRLILKEHGGKSGRVIGLEQAQGDFVWFVDHDDIVAPNAVTLLKIETEKESEYDRWRFPYYQFFGDLSIEERQKMKQGTLQPNDKERMKDLVVWDAVYSRAFLQGNDILPRPKQIQAAAEYWGIEDFRPFSVDTIFILECKEKGMFTKELDCKPLYHYRRHEKSETLNFSEEAISKRAKSKYHRALVYLYHAICCKREYLEQRNEYGVANEETATKAVLELRRAIRSLVISPEEYWREGMQFAMQNKVFFKKTIPEYHFSFLKYLRAQKPADRMKPETWFSYFSYTERGAKLLRLSKKPSLGRNKIILWKKLKYFVLKKENQKLGIKENR